MEFETVILRFRDLVTENNVTIARHKDMIDKKGYVWWGWWNKGNEKLPFEEFCVLKGEIESKPKYFYLMDSGQEKLYKAECLDIKCSGSDKKLSPELECTPIIIMNKSIMHGLNLIKLKNVRLMKLRIIHM